MPNIQKIFNQFNQNAQHTVAPSYQQRHKQLTLLEKLIIQHAKTLAQAINTDFGHRARAETNTIDIVPAITCIHYIKKNLKTWMKPNIRQVPWYLKKMQAAIIHQPLGVIGIIVPFNYPLMLLIQPLAYAMAAGNKVMVNVSDLTPSLGTAFARLIESTTLSNNVAIINADLNVAKQFASLPFNHLFFTGSSVVAKQILHAAADNLTPTTLELGGKSPAIIAANYSVSKAAKHIIHSKLINAGQTCIATDYVLLPHSQLNSFIQAAKKAAAHFYPQQKLDSTLINEQQTMRLTTYLEDAQQKGGHITHLFTSPQTSGVAPCIVTHVTTDMLVMQQELFGPVLPIITYNDWQEAISFIQQQPNPLAIYCFSHQKNQIKQVLTQTRSGAVLVNGCLIHIAIDDLPFGGVGASGFGRYHGREGFINFSNQRAFVKQSRFNLMRFFMPPYNLLKRLLLYVLFAIK